MMKKKIILCIASLIAVAMPLSAVFNERDISRTIAVLKQELKVAYADRIEQAERKSAEDPSTQDQHLKMLRMTEECNELSLVLYSQEIDFTFDITYALNKVREEYESFKSITMPHIDNISDLDTEIERYDKLVKSLASIPPVHKFVRARVDSLMVSEILENYGNASAQDSWNVVKFFKELQAKDTMANTAVDSTDMAIFILDEETIADRDTCVALANMILRSYQIERERIIRDDEEYSKLRSSLDNAYEYAMSRSQVIRDNIYHKGQDNYFKVLTNFKHHFREASGDLNKRLNARKESAAYSSGSEWSGFVLLQTLFYALFYLLQAIVFFIIIYYGLARWIKRFRTPEFKAVRPYVTVLSAVIWVALLALVALFGPLGNFAVLAARIVFLYLWLVISILFSVIIGVPADNMKKAVFAFLPFFILSLIIMVARMLFVPDKILNLILSPLLVVFVIWQIVDCIKLSESKMPAMMIYIQRVSLVAMIISLVIAVMGYALLSLQILLWWCFQLSFIASITALNMLLGRYREKHLKKRIAKYMSQHKMAKHPENGDCIKVTWLYDFLKKTLIPVLGILSVVISARWAVELFNLAGVSHSLFVEPFVNLTNAEGTTILQLTLSGLLSVSGLYFVFRYLNYLIRSFYRTFRLESVIKYKGRDIIKANEVNLTLANNVIGIMIWGLFLIYAVYLVKLPVGALSAIFAGLAAGIGLALKDVLNNFIYGIQLMSGRLRVGDIVECDGVRGTVNKISYQTTDIQTFCGPVISFTNTTLFNKSFQNITKNTPYEYLKIPVCISYSSNFDKVRQVLTDALKPKLEEKDKLGRHIVDQSYGIAITFGDFLDSSVTVAIKQNVLSECKWTYTSEVNELVFKLFKENGIEIPFNQQEILIHNFPVKTE